MGSRDGLYLGVGYAPACLHNGIYGLGVDVAEKENFVAIGDARDIPLLLGMIIIVWNSCELGLRGMLRTLASKGHYAYHNPVEVLISELGAVEITHALQCYVYEFPDDQSEISDAIAYVVKAIDICRVYRNYYVHDIHGVTKYGIDFSDKLMDDEITITDAMMEGPFASVYSKTAKGKQKFILDFISVERLREFNNHLASLEEYIRTLDRVIYQFLSKRVLDDPARIPEKMPIFAPLKKPALDHAKMKRPPAFSIFTPIDDE